MTDLPLTCPTCGAHFLATAGKAKVFCVECGAIIDRSGAEDVVAAQSATVLDTSNLARARAAFQVARFPIVDKKTGQKGDRLVQLWTMLLFHGNNSRSAWGVRTAKKEIAGYFAQKVWQEALDLAGSDRQQLIVEQLLDSAQVFLTTCRDDSKYGSKLLGVMRMNANDVAAKAGEDVCKGIISFLLHIELPGESEAIIHAAVMAYPRVFSEHREALNDAMQACLSDDERQQALQIVARIAEANRQFNRRA